MSAISDALREDIALMDAKLAAMRQLRLEASARHEVHLLGQVRGH